VSEVYDGGQRLSGALWLPQKLQVGDYLILENKNSRTGGSRYRVTNVRWCHDPADMYFWEAEFEPRVFSGETETS